MFTTNYKLAALLLAAATATASPLAPRQGSLLDIVIADINIDIDIDIVGVIGGLFNNGGQDANTIRCLRGEEEGYNANGITNIDVDILLGEIDLEVLLQQLGLDDILDIEDLLDLSVVLNLGGDGTVQITLGEIIRRLSGGNQYGGYNGGNYGGEQYGGYNPGWTYGECREGAFADGELCLNPILCPILQAILPAFPLLGCPTSQYGSGWGYGDDYASAPMPTNWKPKKYCENNQLCKADQYGAYNCEDSRWCKPTTPENGYLAPTAYESTPPAGYNSEGGNGYPSAPAYAPAGNYEGASDSGYPAPGGYSGAGRCRNDELTVDLDLAVEVDIDLVSVSVQADAVITLGTLSSGCAEQRCQRMCEANSYRGNSPAGQDCRAFATYNEPATNDVLCALYGDVIVAANFEEGDFAVRAFNLNIDIEVDVADLD